MANDYPGDTAPHPEDIPNLSLSKINQLLYLLGSINGANYPADVAPHPNDTANLSLHKINRILKEGSFGGGGGGVAWGAITGDIEDQSDLDTALGTKQTAAQVQALIDAALAGKGVIGTAALSIDNADEITVDHADGILLGLNGGSTVSYANANGVLTVTYTAGDPGAQNFPNVTWESTASLTVSISSVSATGFTATFLNSTTGLAAGTAVDVVRITVHKLSQ